MIGTRAGTEESVARAIGNLVTTAPPYNLIPTPRSDKADHPSYRPDVDGLRAVAVTAVVAFHAAGARVPGGFIGVDVFFVISGFLISSILMKGLERDTYSLSEFYARRIRRTHRELSA